METIPLTRWTKSHPLNQVISNPTSRVQTIFATNNECQFAAFLSSLEPRTVNDALQDSDWVKAMKDELAEFERNEVWALGPTLQSLVPDGFTGINRTKMV